MEMTFRERKPPMKTKQGDNDSCTNLALLMDDTRQRLNY